MPPLDAVSSSPPGWEVVKTDSYPWAREYFGSRASWDRYVAWHPGLPATSTDAVLPPITLDVISTSDSTSLSTYGVEVCYRFRNYRIYEFKRVDLAGGVIGRSATYYVPSLQTTWVAVYWEWPVKVGQDQRYQRVVLNLSRPTLGRLASPVVPDDVLDRLQVTLGDALGGSYGGVSDKELMAVQAFLVDFARKLIVSNAGRTGGGPWTS
jgi:hypothetical protein